MKKVSASFIILLTLLFFISCKKEISPAENAQSVPVVLTTQDTINTILTPPPPVIGLEIGNKAPAFDLKDSSNQAVSLYSVKEKLVLIDFWASWCKPCRIENKKLIDIYSKYKNAAFKAGTGFEIFSVSIDERADGWKKQLQIDKYNWRYQVIDNGYAVANLYKVSSIPKNHLIDKNGIILAKDIRDSVVEKTLAGLLQ